MSNWPGYVSQFQTQRKRIYGTYSASPIILLILGVLCLLFCVIALVVEIRTSELAVYSQHMDEMPWGVFLQPWLLVAGTNPMSEKLTWIYGWIVEIIDLIYAFGLNHATDALRQTNPAIAKFYGIGGVMLLLLNGYSNFKSLPGADPLMQLLVCLAVTIGVVALPVIGLALIERAIDKFEENLNGSYS